MGRGGVDRAAPGVGDAAAGEVGEVIEQVAAVGLDDVGVDLGAAVEAGAHRDPAAAPAEGDAAVGRGAEVVDEGAAVGDRLAAGPAELLDHLGDGLGDDDVGRGDGEAVAERAAGGRPPPIARTPRARGRGRRWVVRLDPVGGLAEAAHRRGLVYLDAVVEEAFADREGEAGRLDRRGAGFHHPGAELGRGADRSDLGGVERAQPVGDAELPTGPSAAGPVPSWAGVVDTSR